MDPYVATPEQIDGVLRVFLSPMLTWLHTASSEDMEKRFARRYGEGGVREYFYHLCDLVSETESAFGPDDYREFKLKSKDERHNIAKLDVEDLTKLISGVVIEKLKEIYGTDELPSGEKSIGS